MLFSSFRGRPRGNENRDAFGGHTHRGFPKRGGRTKASPKTQLKSPRITQSYRAYNQGLGPRYGLAEACCHPPRHNRGSQFLLVHRSKCSATRRTLVILFCFEGFCPLQLHHANCMLTRSILRLGMLRGFREVSKYDQIFAFMQQHVIHILAMQETHCERTQEFSKSGYLILHSSSPSSPKHGVGFIVAPSLRPYVHSFLPLGPRMCTLSISTSPKPLQLFCVYAPSLVQDAADDRRRKQEFWDEFQEQV